MLAQPLGIEQADATSFRLDRALAGRVVEGARDRLPAQRQRCRELLLRQFHYRFVPLGRLMQEEVADLLEGGLAGHFQEALVGTVERVCEQVEPAKGDFGKELLERADRVEAEAEQRASLSVTAE